MMFIWKATYFLNDNPVEIRRLRTTAISFDTAVWNVHAALEVINPGNYTITSVKLKRRQ